MMSTHRISAGLIIVMIFSVLGGAIWFRYTSHKEKEYAVRELTQHVLRHEGVFVDLSGASTSLHDLSGKPTLVMTWATWCSLCRDQLFLFDQIMSEYPDLTVVAVNRDEELFQISAYREHVGLPDSIRYVVDTQDAFFEAFNGYTTPEIALYDISGKVVWRVDGVTSAEEVRTALDALF